MQKRQVKLIVAFVLSVALVIGIYVFQSSRPALHSNSNVPSSNAGLDDGQLLSAFSSTCAPGGSSSGVYAVESVGYSPKGLYDGEVCANGTVNGGFDVLYLVDQNDVMNDVRAMTATNSHEGQCFVVGPWWIISIVHSGGPTGSDLVDSGFEARALLGSVWGTCPSY
jgi:hypothetical protein